MSRRQSRAAGSWTNLPLTQVVGASLNTPSPATALGAPPEEPNQQLPHCQPGDQCCHRLPLSEPGQTFVQSRPRRTPQSHKPERGTSRSGPPARRPASPAARPSPEPSTVPLPPERQPPHSYRLRCSLKSAVSARRASRSWMGAGTMMPDSREGGILGAAILPLALRPSPTRRREEREKGRETTGEVMETQSAQLWLPQPASPRSRGAARQRARD